IWPRQPEYLNKTAGDFLEGFSFTPAIGGWGLANTLAEERTERAKTFESNLKANVRYAQPARAQQFLGFLNPALNQTLVRRHIERIAKQTQEVITRQASLS